MNVSRNDRYSLLWKALQDVIELELRAKELYELFDRLDEKGLKNRFLAILKESEELHKEIHILWLQEKEQMS